MSLVHQALRKAAQEKLRRTGEVPAVTDPLSVHQPAGSNTAPAAAENTIAPAATPAPAAANPPAPASVPSQSLGFLPVLLSIVAFVAIVAMVFLVIRVTMTPPQAVGTTTPPPPSVETGPTPMPVTPTDGGNPQVAPATAASQELAAKYELTGITQFPDGRQAAVINGQLRSEDQYVDGAIVKKIERDRVTLEADGETIVKRLF